MNSRITDIVMHGIVLLTAFPVHECAHAVTAHWLGDDTAKNQGRITLNPLKHIDPMGTLFMLIAGFGWARAVPINPNNFKNRKVGMAVSSLAGPLSNLILAYFSIIVYKAVIYSPLAAENSYVSAFAKVFLYSTFLNVGLAVFNLLPVPPLDGSRIFTLLFPERMYFKIMNYENIIFIVFFAAVFLGFFDRPIYFLQDKALDFMNLITAWVDILMMMIYS